MRKIVLAGAAMLLAGAGSAGAADVLPAPVYEAPIYDAPIAQPVASAGGWYLRGDVGYSSNNIKGADFWQGAKGNPANWAPFTSGKIRGSYSVGGGVGYQATRHLRGDLTLDYFGKADFRGSTKGDGGGGLGLPGCGGPCISTDIASVSSLSLLANAYVDFYKQGRFTLYGGAGLGGTRVKWGNLANTSCADDGSGCEGPFNHNGRSSWRFTYALMAGATVDLTCKLKADVGYRYRRVSGGEMFGFTTTSFDGRSGTQIYDRGFDSHQVRGGLRYSLGAGDCAQEQVYIEPAPIMPAVYK